MLRWILYLALAASLYFIYQDYTGRGGRSVVRAPATPIATREPSGHLGGGLNPFVADTMPGGAPQRPPMPKIPGR